MLWTLHCKLRILGRRSRCPAGTSTRASNTGLPALNLWAQRGQPISTASTVSHILLGRCVGLGHHVKLKSLRACTLTSKIARHTQPRSADASGKSSYDNTATNPPLRASATQSAALYPNHSTRVRLPGASGHNLASNNSEQCFHSVHMQHKTLASHKQTSVPGRRACQHGPTL